MLKETFELICKQLGLFYTHEFPSTGLTEQVPRVIEIDPQALGTGSDRIFIIQNNKRIEVKKSLVLTSWYFNSLDEETYGSIISFLEQLMHYGYKIYISSTTGLELIEESVLLNRLICNMVPVNTDLAIKWAAEKQLSRSSIDIINTARLLMIIRKLWEFKRELGLAKLAEIKSDYWYPLISPLLYQNPRAFLEELGDGAKEEFAWRYNRGTAIPEIIGTEKIRSLTLRGLVNDEEVAFICSRFNSLHQLIIIHSEINAKQLSMLLNANKNLQRLTLHECLQLNEGELEIDAGALVLLSELVISQVRTFSPFIFKTLLMRAQQVTRLKLEMCWLTQHIGDDFWASSSQPLLKLDEFISTDFIMHEKAARNFIVNCTKNASVVSLSHDMNYVAEQYANTSALEIDGDFFPDPINFLKLMQKPRISLTSNSSLPSFLNDLIMKNKSEDIQIDGALNKIHELSLCDNAITGAHLETVLRMIPKVNVLDLTLCTSLDQDQFNGDLIPMLPELRVLRASNSVLTSKQLIAILNNAPRLARLDLVACKNIEFNSFDLRAGQLNELAELSLSYPSITEKEFSMLFAIAPNLNSIFLNNHIFIKEKGNIFENIPSLIRLTQLKLSFDKTVEQFWGDVILSNLKELFCAGTCLDYSKLALNVPNLIKLHLANRDPSFIPEKKIKPPLGLRQLSVKDIFVDFNSCASLKALLIRRDTASFADIDAIVPNSLLQLKQLDLLSTYFEFHHVQRMLIAAPNIQHLRIIGGLQATSETFDIQGWLPFLRTLHIEMSHFSRETLIQLMSMAPGLQQVTLTNCYLINDEHLPDLQRAFPGVHIVISGIKVPSNVSSEINMQPSVSDPSSNQRTFKPDGLLEHDLSNKLSFIRVFKKADGNNPSPHRDHNDLFVYNRAMEIFQQYEPLETDLEPYACALSSIEEMEREFLAAKTQYTEQGIRDDTFFAKRKFDIRLEPKWILLSARSLDDTLLAFSIYPPMKCNIYRHKKLGLYFFCPSAPFVGRVRVQYRIKAGETTHQISNNLPIVADLQGHCAALRFDSDGLLDRTSGAYQALMQAEPAVRVAALKHFCTFDKESAPNFHGNRPALLNHLIHYQGGACRHRSDLFIALAEQLGIDVYWLENIVHAFVLVCEDGAKPYTLQLGGTTVELIECVEPEEPVVQAQLPTYNKPDKRNPFRSWKLTPLSASNMIALISELIARGARHKKQLLLTQNQRDIGELHKAILLSTNRDECFFSVNLDSLALYANRIVAGQQMVVNSPELTFLKQAEAQPEKTFTWFINWSNPQAEHMSYNALINNEARQLNDYSLPANVATVLVMDEFSALSMGKDFYSRMELRSCMPDLMHFIEPEIISAVPDQQDVLLTMPYHWKRDILGYISIHHDQLDVIPGGLLKAIERAQSGEQLTFTLHNASLELDEFRFFWDELSIARRFYFNASLNTLPANVVVRLAKPIYNMRIFASCFSDGLEFHDTEMPNEYVLNEATWPSFFLGQCVGDQGIELARGLLEQAFGQDLSLVVSEPLSKAHWYKLLDEAQTYHVTLSLKLLPGVILPDEYLQSVAQEYVVTEPSALIKWIVSSDIDFACAEEQATHIIPIDINTSFDSLFFKVKRRTDTENRLSFFSVRVDLLHAIERGESVVFEGQFSEQLIKRLSTLLVQPGYLLVNGRYIRVRGPITLVSSNAACFSRMPYQEITYVADEDFALLSFSQSNRLRACYERLAIQVKHSHFITYPRDNPAQQEQWLNRLIYQLHASIGQTEPIYAPIASSSSDPVSRPTQPEELLTQLEQHPFLFLSSESGEGKSYFIRYRLPEYGATIGKEITIFNELRDLEAWATASGAGKKILFLDEANISVEQYHYFNNLARGERVIWINGMRYELSPDHHVVFAGNPLSYGGRFQADLFNRFLNYMEFRGEPLDLILEPMAKLFGNDWPELASLLHYWYREAKTKGLNITPRNAEMMCLNAFIMQWNMPAMPPRILMSYAILQELKTLSVNKDSGQPLRKELRTATLTSKQRNEFKNHLFHKMPQASNDDFVWTNSRKKIANKIFLALQVRSEKIKRATDQEGVFTQAQGINGFIIEGEQGLGKTQLISTVLKQAELKLGIDFEIIQLGKADTRKKLYEAFHAGRIVVIDEFNTFPDEQLMNDYLSGYDEFKKPAQNPGFFVLGAQNPITFEQRKPLSKALENRLKTITLPDYTKEELRVILQHKFKLSEELIELRINQYFQAKNYAERQRLFPAPDTRTLMNQASLDEKELPPPGLSLD